MKNNSDIVPPDLSILSKPCSISAGSETNNNSTSPDVPGNLNFRSTPAGRGILVVDREVPPFDKNAGARSTFNYLKLFVELGLKVYFLPDDFERREPYTTALENLGAEVLCGEWFRSNWKQWVLDNASSLQYVFFNRPDTTLNYIDFIKANTRCTIIYQGHDLHYLRLSRKFEIDGDPQTGREAEKYRVIEQDIMAVSDVILTFSDYERAIIAGLFPRKPVHTVPLFFYDRFPEEPIDFSARRGIMFVGGCDHKPNQDAILWFAREVFPKVLEKIPDLVLHVIGSSPPPEVRRLASDKIRIAGHVSEEELEEYYRRIRIVIVPLRFGAGVKGKTVEALYRGVPLVSTSTGIEGIPGVEAIVQPANSEAEFSRRIIGLYGDPRKLALLSTRYSDYAKEHFSFEKTKVAIAGILLNTPQPVRSALVMDQELAECRRLLTMKDHLLVKHEQQIRDLHESLSWRITGPLRRIYDILFKPGR